MPLYEYELDEDHPECQICTGRFAVLQGIDESALKHCPGCGLSCRRVVSSVSIKVSPSLTPDKAAKRGFTTWKRAREGEWEKVAGPGVDAIVSTDEDRKAVEEEKKSKKRLDL